MECDSAQYPKSRQYGQDNAKLPALPKTAIENLMAPCIVIAFPRGVGTAKHVSRLTVSSSLSYSWRESK
jgi:hypothetical protein